MRCGRFSLRGLLSQSEDERAGPTSDEDLDTVGRSAFPLRRDPELPLLDIVWWMNRELIHHTAEVAFVRDLYTTRS